MNIYKSNNNNLEEQEAIRGMEPRNSGTRILVMTYNSCANSLHNQGHQCSVSNVTTLIIPISEGGTNS